MVLNQLLPACMTLIGLSILRPSWNDSDWISRISDLKSQQSSPLCKVCKFIAPLLECLHPDQQMKENIVHNVNLHMHRESSNTSLFSEQQGIFTARQHASANTFNANIFPTGFGGYLHCYGWVCYINVMSGPLSVNSLFCLETQKVKSETFVDIFFSR